MTSPALSGRAQVILIVSGEAKGEMKGKHGGVYYETICSLPKNLIPGRIFGFKPICRVFMHWRVLKFLQSLRVTEAGCAEWVGATDAHGYGVLSWEGRLKRATHVSWFIKYKRWPEKLMLHRCDNPACVRVAHLFEGDHQDNTADCVAKGRHHHKVTQAQVEEIRELGKTRIPLAELAQRYGISQGNISSILHGKVGPALTEKPARKPHAVHRNAQRTEFRGEMLTFGQIADLCGLNVKTVHNRYLRGVRGDDLGKPPHKVKRKPYERRA